MMKNTLYAFLLCIIILGCESKEKSIEFPISQEIIGLASPIRLQPDSTIIYLEDYFMNPENMDSSKLPYGLEVYYSKDNIIKVKGDIKEPIEQAQFLFGDTTYSIPIFKNQKIRYRFEIPLEGEYEEVSIKANFNGWNHKASTMLKEGDNWTYEIDLNPGEYQYLLVIDDQELLDPFNQDSVDNGTGGFNSRFFAGEKESEALFIYGSEVQENTIKIQTKNKSILGYIAFWENYVFAKQLSNESTDAFEIEIPSSAAKMDRSHIRVWAFNENSLSNDMLIPLDKGKIITETSSLNRRDKQSMRMYFLMVDRFMNGDTENDKMVDDPMIKPLANYLGGDITGVENKVKEGYFDELYMNTVWLSPIGLNPEGAWGLWDKGGVVSKFSGYHGYWPAQSKAIDYRFGNEDELNSLINEVHNHSSNILLDYVANHVHLDHPVYKQHPDWATNLYLPDSTLNTEKWDEYRLTTWFDKHLPTLDLENPIVTEAMSDSAAYWFETYDIDGFRHDATKHIPELFWRTLTRKLKQRVMLPENRSIYQIGETYGNAELIGSYVNSGQMDAQFDFNVYDRSINTLIDENKSMSELANTLKESMRFYGYHNLMGYISGNQDRPRFISLADGSVDPGEDTKLAGWTRKIDNNGEIGFQRLAQLHALNFTIPGIPVIYYGDEIGLPGGNDPDNRRMMLFENLTEDQQNMKSIVTRLSKLRSEHMALNYGDLNFISEDGPILAFERIYFDDKVIVIINNSSESSEINISVSEELKGNFDSSIENTSDGISVTMKPHSFEILTK